MFYTKEVGLYRLESYENEWGSIVEGEWTLAKTLKVDIQPYSKEKLERDYGFKLETTKRMFCGLDDDIQEDTLVEYRSELYRVVNIVEWDDYLDIALDKAKGVELNE